MAKQWPSNTLKRNAIYMRRQSLDPDGEGGVGMSCAKAEYGQARQGIAELGKGRDLKR